MVSEGQKVTVDGKIVKKEEEEIGEDNKVKVGDGDELAALMSADGQDAILAEMSGGDKKKSKKNKKDKAEKLAKAKAEKIAKEKESR